MPQTSVLNSVSQSINQRAKDKMLVFLETAGTVVLTLKIDGNPIFILLYPKWFFILIVYYRNFNIFNNNNNNNGLLTVYPPSICSPVKKYNIKKNPQIAQARNMSIGEQWHCYVTLKVKGFVWEKNLLFL